MITNALARHSLAPPGLVARRAGGARVGRGKFKKPLRRELFASHAACARFFACPQPQPHLRAGGVRTPQTRGLAAIAVLLIQSAPPFFRLERTGAGLRRQLAEHLSCRRVRTGWLHPAPGPVELDVPGNLVALRPLLELLHGEESVRVGHDGVVLRIHLAELPGLGLVLAEIAPGLAEQVLGLS